MQILHQELAYQGKIISVNKCLFQEEGHKRQYDVIAHPGGAAILPFIDDKNILLIRQYRVAVNEVLWEVPAGLLEKGGDPQICAERELQEETGYGAHKIISFGSILSSPGILNEKIHLFVAQDLYPSFKECDEDEKIDKKIVSLEHALQMVDDGEIKDAKTTLLLLKYATWRH